MKIVQHGKKRKAISPVLATVILIAITLIAAIAVAGFVFGLFGTFTSSAQVSVTTVRCTTVASPVCTLTLTNTGTSSTTVIAASGWIKYSGVTSTGITAAWSGGVLTAGTSATGTITFTDLTIPVSGESFVGQLSTANGGAISFTGQFP
jgi:flagellin-like protein